MRWPVYHFTMLRDLPAILGSGILASLEAGRAAVSVTRSFNHLYSRPEYRRDVLLVLDRRRLAQRYRLEPVYGDVDKPKTEVDRARWRRQGLFAPGTTWTPEMIAACRQHGREAEERIHRAVAPLQDYLSEIVLSDALWSVDAYPVEAIFGYAERHRVPVSLATYRYGSAWLARRRPIGPGDLAAA